MAIEGLKHRQLPETLVQLMFRIQLTLSFKFHFINSLNFTTIQVTLLCYLGFCSYSIWVLQWLFWLNDSNFRDFYKPLQSKDTEHLDSVQNALFGDFIFSSR